MLSVLSIIFFFLSVFIQEAPERSPTAGTWLSSQDSRPSWFPVGESLLFPGCGGRTPAAPEPQAPLLVTASQGQLVQEACPATALQAAPCPSQDAGHRPHVS